MKKIKQAWLKMKNNKFIKFMKILFFINLAVFVLYIVPLLIHHFTVVHTGNWDNPAVHICKALMPFLMYTPMFSVFCAALELISMLPRLLFKPDRKKTTDEMAAIVVWGFACVVPPFLAYCITLNLFMF